MAVRAILQRSPAMSGAFSYRGISADILPASIPRYTARCMTTATASAQATTVTTFELMAYILRIPIFCGGIVEKRQFQDMHSLNSSHNLSRYN
jgi:hypothetical protein